MPDFNVTDYQPGFGGKIDSSGNVKNFADTITGSGSTAKVKVDIGDVDVTLNASDLAIGAVEIKDATSESRMAVNSDGTLNIRIVGSISGGVFGP